MATLEKFTLPTVQDLKAEGMLFAAGALLCQLGHVRLYGCHFGLRSMLDADRAVFYRGYDAAHTMALR